MDGHTAIRRATWAIPLCTVLLLLLGWSAIGRSEQLIGGSGRLLRQQIVWSILGLAVLGAASAVDYSRIARRAYLAFALILIALFAVYAFPPINGAQRWIRFGGIGVQPSEFAKVIFVVALARYLAYRNVAASFVGMGWPLAMATMPMLLILKEPDLGTSLVFLPVLFAMLLAAGARRRDLLRLALAGIMLMPLLWSQMSREQRSRVTALWEQNAPRQRATIDGFHLDQAKRMFSLGGPWGSFITSDADADLPACRVPEPHTDSVFCVLGERFGLAGAAIVLLLFGGLVAACLQVAARAEEPSSRLTAAGVAALFGAEALINTGMMTGLLPITGLSLPLVSYGGSGLVAHCLAVGMVMSIALAECRR